MNIKARYNGIIEYIEGLYDGNGIINFIPTRDAAENIAKREGMTYRDTNTAFMFIAGMSLLDYIRERRLMAVYKDIVNSDIFDVSRYIERSGYNDQSALGKAFKEKFNMAPKQLFESKDNSGYMAPITWDRLEDVDNRKGDIREDKSNDKLFGIDKNSIRIYEEVREYQCLYEFDNGTSEICYRISRDYDIPLRKVFEFIDELNIKELGCFMGKTIDEKYKTLVSRIKNHIKLLKWTDWSVAQMYNLLDTVKSDFEFQEGDQDVITLWETSQLASYSFYELRQLLNAYSNKSEYGTVEDLLSATLLFERTNSIEKDVDRIVECEQELKKMASPEHMYKYMEDNDYENSIDYYLDQRQAERDMQGW